MLTGSINYALSLGFVLTFLLASFGITAMIHTFRDLAGLHITPAKTAPVFAGQTARFAFALHNPARTPRFSVALTRDQRESHVVDIPPESTAIATTGVPAAKRGLLLPGRLTLCTRFPVGLYYAWSYVDLDTHCIVYPRPAPPGLPLPPLRAGNREGAATAQGQDDFAGLRLYYPGDSPRHIAWKAAAREQVLLTKQFTGHATAELWLKPELIPDRIDYEEKLSRLTRWVLDAHAAGLAYGLKLPRVTVDVGTGDAHRDRCLEALALA
jgi:uncharacterized protein (DUF58 family)